MFPSFAVGGRHRQVVGASRPAQTTGTPHDPRQAPAANLLSFRPNPGAPRGATAGAGMPRAEDHTRSRIAPSREPPTTGSFQTPPGRGIEGVLAQKGGHPEQAAPRMVSRGGGSASPGAKSPLVTLSRVSRSRKRGEGMHRPRGVKPECSGLSARSGARKSRGRCKRTSREPD